MARHTRVSVSPPRKALSPTGRRVLARAAAFAAMAVDSATLAALRQGYWQRMEGGPLAGAFVLLTSEAPRGIEDLPRLKREIAALRLLPQRLEALRSPPPTPR